MHAKNPTRIGKTKNRSFENRPDGRFLVYWKPIGFGLGFPQGSIKKQLNEFFGQNVWSHLFEIE
jgi:hypothetical protein